MAKKYELWLDESGKFEDKDAKSNKDNPSLIGGILVEKNMVKKIDFNRIIKEGKGHASEMRSDERQRYQIEPLEKIKDDYNAKLFYIENPNYEYEKTNRELYLRMMAEGLLQLMQVLNAENESVELDVIIAQRQDFRAKRKIEKEEYVILLERIIKNKKKQNKIFLHEKSKLSFYVAVANKEPKLSFADFACNLRFCRKKDKFRNCQDRIEKLFADAYLFTINEVPTTSYINKLLSNNMVADAIYEAFTTTEQIDLQKELKKICDRMELTSYRLVKSQLKQFTADIVSYVANEDDYEIEEQLLKKINDCLIPMLKQRRLPFESCQFQLLLQLIDMFLREGDIIAARRALEECKQVQQIFGNSLENVFSYYQAIEKEAVLLIDEFRYEEADTLMGKACESYENIMNTIIIDSNLKERFPNIKSEYFGDALCMKIYAEMFLQRKEPHRYEQLCKESDLAIQQYPDSEGELERHRQYRSHIELEAGNYESALQWLMMAKMYTKLSVAPLDISNFLHAVDTTEYIISCQYYLMYYLLIMAEAGKARDSLADVMYNALCGQSEFLKKSGIMLKNSVKDKTDSNFMEINIKNAVQKSSGINYHPMEIVHWKLASYYFYNEKYDEAIIYYESAYKICCKCSNYDTMKITGLGILAEMICCMVEAKMEDTSVQKYKLLLNETKILLEKNFPENTKTLLREMKKLEEGALKNDKVDSKSMYELSRIITY